MKKSFLNKLLSGFLALTLVSSLSVSFSLAASTDGAVVQEKIESILAFMLREEELYDLENVDTSNLSIGCSIPAYEVIGDELILSEINYYPILDNTGAPVLLAASRIKNGEAAVSISSTFIDALKAVKPNVEIALIYDNHGVFLSQDYALTQIMEISENEGVGRGCIESISEAQLRTVNNVPLCVAAELCVPNVQPFGSDDEEMYLKVELIKQTTNKNCWAACAACILNYLHRNDAAPWNSTPDKIVREYGSETCISESLIGWLNRNYNIYYTFVGSTSNDFSNIWASLNAYHPVYGDFEGQNSNHAMVIRGVNYNGIFSVMDPTSGKYHAGDIIGTGKNRPFTITLPATNNTYNLRYYAYRL